MEKAGSVKCEPGVQGFEHVKDVQFLQKPSRFTSGDQFELFLPLSATVLSQK